RLHHLGSKAEEPVPAARAPQKDGVSRIETPATRPRYRMGLEERARRRQSLGHAANPGADPGRHAWRGPLPVKAGKSNAPAHGDQHDRKRLRLPTGKSRLAGPVHTRTSNVPKRETRRPNRLHIASPELDQRPPVGARHIAVVPAGGRKTTERPAVAGGAVGIAVQ